jgi:hypothetical protein
MVCRKGPENEQKISEIELLFENWRYLNNSAGFSMLGPQIRRLKQLKKR